MKKINLLTAVLAFAAAIAGTFAGELIYASTPASIAKESVYDRVKRTETIKCGYSSWPPLIVKDPNTGRLSGIAYDYLEALGTNLHLKIDWSQEVSWGDFPAALATGRIDGFCAGVWANASRAREIDFVRPMLFQPIYAYVRTGDHRFDKDLASINDPAVTLATADGEMSSLIAATDFPAAKQVQLAQLSSGSELFVNIATGKADVTFSDAVTAANYDAQNPGKIRKLFSKTPIRVFGATIGIARGQDEFRRMMDTATEELLLNGTLDKIIAQYEEHPGTLLRVARPYADQPERH